MANLDAVSVGDFLALRSRSGWNGSELTKIQVTRITKTKVVCGERHFSKRNGNEYGRSKYLRAWVEPWSQQHDDEKAALRIELERRAAIRWLDNAPWDKLSLDQLLQVKYTVIDLLTKEGT